MSESIETTIVDNDDTLTMVAEIVSAYVSNNSVPATEIAELIKTVHSALGTLGHATAEAEPVKLNPAVPVKKSVTNEYIVCLEDGRKFKSLKRHLRTQYNMSPEDYREKWGLVSDYPMVAPSYAEARSNLAKSMGLGQQRKGAKAASKETSAPKRASRKKAS